MNKSKVKVENPAENETMEQTGSSDDSFYLTASDEDGDSSDTEEFDHIILKHPVAIARPSTAEIYTGKMSGEIELWKFGCPSYFKRVSKNSSMADVLSIAANSIYGCQQENISLFHQFRVLEPSGNICDHVTSINGSAKVYMVQMQQHRKPTTLLTSEKDMINQWESGSRVLMSCGHAVTPDNLFEYCLNKLKNGFPEIGCPAIPDPDRNDQCGKIWDYTEIRQKACLSNDECNMFEIMLSFNQIQREKDIYFCPLCGKLIASSCSENGYCVCQGCEKVCGGLYKFCIFCLQSWKSAVAYGVCGNGECNQSLQKRREILSGCPTKVIVEVPNCPIVRACPACNCIVQHDGDVCKHMECPSIHCRTKFCFICLKIKTDKYYWPCGGAFEKCDPVPRQSI